MSLPFTRNKSPKIQWIAFLWGRIGELNAGAGILHPLFLLRVRPYLAEPELPPHPSRSRNEQWQYENRVTAGDDISISDMRTHTTCYGRRKNANYSPVCFGFKARNRNYVRKQYYLYLRFTSDYQRYWKSSATVFRHGLWRYGQHQTILCSRWWLALLGFDTL